MIRRRTDEQVLASAAQMDAATEPIDGLTERERAILDFEGSAHWQYAGAKETEIRRRFGIGATRYYQLLNALLDRPEALVYAPMLIKRLRRLRQARAVSRRHPSG